MSDMAKDVAYWESLRKEKGERYVRWNGYTMAQFTVVLALLSGLSVSALGAGITLLQRSPVFVHGGHGSAFVIGMVCFVAVILLTLLAAISRLLDFRLTARKVRGRLDRTMFGWDDKQFGKISWFLFWMAAAAFGVGTSLFAFSVYVGFVLQISGCK